MSAVLGFLHAVYSFFVEDGSIVVGAIVALILVAVLAVWRPFGSAAAFAGPLLFALIAVMLAVNLLWVAQQARPRH